MSTCDRCCIFRAQTIVSVYNQSDIPCEHIFTVVYLSFAHPLTIYMHIYIATLKSVRGGISYLRNHLLLFVFNIGLNHIC